MDTETSAAERAYRHAKEAILSRRYGGGQLISEGDVAADVGVSRTPVREALLRLQSEGLVRLYPKRGALVVPVSQTEVDDVLETRRLVEGFTAERAATATDAARATLCARLAEQLGRMRTDARKETSSVVLADHAFHRAIVTASGNQILTDMYDSLRDRQLRMMEKGARTVEHLRRNVEEHTRIERAIRNGDVAAAREAVRVHMDSAARVLGARR